MQADPVDVIGLPVHSVKVNKPGRKGHSNAFEHCCQYTELTVGFELKNTTGLPVQVSIIQHYVKYPPMFIIFQYCIADITFLGP